MRSSQTNKFNVSCSSQMAVSMNSLNSSPQKKQSFSTNQSIRSLVDQLQKKLEEQKQKRMQTEQKYESLKISSIHRQQQFRLILNANAATREHTTDTTAKQIFKSIIKNFQGLDTSNQTVTKNQCDHITGRMDIQIKQIMQTAKQQIQKTKILSSESYAFIRTEVQSVLSTTRKIQQQNTVLKDKFRRQQAKNKILIEQKQLLLQEVAYKKKCITKLYSQIKLLKSKMKNQAKFSQYNHSKQLENNDCRFMCEPEISINKTDYISSQKIFQNSKSNSKLLNSSNYSSYTKTKPRSQYSHRYNNKIQNQVKTSAQIDTIIAKNKKSQKDQKNLNQVNEKSDNKHQERAIRHMRNCLDRSQRKSLSLAKIVTKMENRNNFANQAITQALKLFEKQIEGIIMSKQSDQYKKQKLNQTKKLIHSLTSLKRRLLALQQPSLNCGWGDQLQKSIRLLVDDTNIRQQIE